MDGAADLLALLPEVQEALCESFDGIDCSVGPGPELSTPPFRLPIRSLGRNVTFVPDLSVSCLEDVETSDMHKILLAKNNAVFTDGQPGSCLELALGRGKDWKTPLTALFDRLFPNKWAFFVVELEHSQPMFHVLCCGQPPASSSHRDDTPDSTEQNSQISSPTESVSESSNFCLWIVPVSRIFAIPPPKKVKVIKKVVKKRTPTGPTDENGVPTGLEEKKKIVRKLVKKEPKEKEEDRDSRTPDALSASTASVATLVGGSSASKLTDPTKLDPKLDNASTSKEENSSASELRKKLAACEEKFQVNGEARQLNGVRSSPSRVSVTPERRLEPIYEGAGKKERCVSPSKVVQQKVVCRVTGPQPSGAEIPVMALQLVLSNCFSYQQLGELRLVHPHWDEIAGQLLNSGYYQLLERCDKLLMKLQRKLHAQPELHYVTSVLTNIQVHVLNPVDVMRAVLDEGVCCFPYGIILDKTFVLLDKIEFAMKGGDQPHFDWEPLAMQAKRAALHYRTRLEKTMEERLGENLRLKAAQRILRLDSFMVESNVAKIEKDQAKVRDDLKWELEQLQQQNQQLRKDNRQLKQDHLKLEARVDILEQKFRTLARLLG